MIPAISEALTSFGAWIFSSQQSMPSVPSCESKGAASHSMTTGLAAYAENAIETIKPSEEKADATFAARA